MFIDNLYSLSEQPKFPSETWTWPYTFMQLYEKKMHKQ